MQVIDANGNMFGYDHLEIIGPDGKPKTIGGGGGSATWGSITGTLSDQTDLQSALNAKFNNPTGTSADYIDGTGALQVFPTLTSADKMVTVGRNSTGSTLYKGTVVYISGSTGNRPNFVKAQANSETTSAGTFGIVLADIPNNSDGQVVTIGTIDSLDTRSTAPHPFTNDTLVDGDTIYLSPTTAGYVTNIKPQAPYHLVYVGKVVRTSPTNGTIVYRIQNGYELDELHDVQIISVANNDLIQWDSATSLWKNRSLDSAGIQPSLGYTPVPDTRTISTSSPLSGGGNLSADRTISISQATTSTSGYLSSTDWNTFSGKQNALTLTTTGTSGAATLVGSTLNIPQYSGGGSVAWGSITGTLSSQTDLQTALNAKQDTLVSGTNIKTINGFSIVGSGNLNTPIGSNGIIKPQTGSYLHTGVIGTGTTTMPSIVGTTNRLYLYPFISSQDIAISAININVTSAVAGSLARIVMYTSGTTNGGDYPNLKAFESTSLDCSTTGIKSASNIMTLEKGRIWWIGVHSSAAGQFLSMLGAQMLPINFTGSNTSNSNIIQTTTFGSLPSSYGSGTFTNANCPYVFFTI